MAAAGIRTVFLTSHYMRGQYQFAQEKYQALFREFEQEVKHQEIPITLLPGAEVFLISGIVDDVKANNLVMGDSNYVLVETELNGFPPDMYRNLFDLLHNGYRPILAHAERYVSVMTKSKEVKDLIDKNIYIQVNSGSLVGGYGDKVKNTAWKLLGKGWVHLMGSDDHVRGDYESFMRAKNKIIEHIDDYTAQLLTQEHPQHIINNERIPYNYVHIHKPHHRRKRSFLRRFLGF